MTCYSYECKECSTIWWELCNAIPCSNQIENLYTTDSNIEHLNYTMLYNTNVNVHVMELPDYLSVFPCSWMNTEEQRKFILEYR